MAESENKRTRRTPQERAAEVDEKIAKIDQSIKELESKKESVVAEYDAKITAARERIKSLEGKKKEILAPKPPGNASNLWRERRRRSWLPSRPANLGRRKSRRSRKSLSWQ